MGPCRGQCCLRVAACTCLPYGPITQLSPYFTQNPCTIKWNGLLSIYLPKLPAENKLRVWSPCGNVFIGWEGAALVILFNKEASRPSEILFGARTKKNDHRHANSFAIKRMGREKWIGLVKRFMYQFHPTSMTFLYLWAWGLSFPPLRGITTGAGMRDIVLTSLERKRDSLRQ